MKIETNRLRSSSAIANVSIISRRKTKIDKIINLPAGTLALLAAIGFLSVGHHQYDLIHLEFNIYIGSIAAAAIVLHHQYLIRIVDGTQIGPAAGIKVRYTQQQQ